MAVYGAKITAIISFKTPTNTFRFLKPLTFIWNVYKDTKTKSSHMHTHLTQDTLYCTKYCKLLVWPNILGKISEKNIA